MAYIDPVQVSPDVYKTLMENDKVRVLEMRLAPGGKDNQHSHPSETVYFLKGGKARIHLPDGKSVDAEIPDRHVMWNNAWTHVVENTGATEIHAIIVQSKA